MSPSGALMNAVPQRCLYFRARLERSADFELLDDGAGKLGRHVVSEPEDAGDIEFNLPPSGKKFFQALAVVHHDACRHQPAPCRLREIHAVLMQQIARCGLQKGFAAWIKPTFHQYVYLAEFIRAHT